MHDELRLPQRRGPVDEIAEAGEFRRRDETKTESRSDFRSSL